MTIGSHIAAASAIKQSLQQILANGKPDDVLHANLEQDGKVLFQGLRAKPKSFLALPGTRQRQAHWARTALADLIAEVRSNSVLSSRPEVRRAMNHLEENAVLSRDARSLNLAHLQSHFKTVIEAAEDAEKADAAGAPSIDREQLLSDAVKHSTLDNQLKHLGDVANGSVEPETKPLGLSKLLEHSMRRVSQLYPELNEKAQAVKKSAKELGISEREHSDNLRFANDVSKFMGKNFPELNSVFPGVPGVNASVAQLISHVRMHWDTGRKELSGSSQARADGWCREVLHGIPLDIERVHEMGIAMLTFSRSTSVSEHKALAEQMGSALIELAKHLRDPQSPFMKLCAIAESGVSQKSPNGEVVQTDYTNTDSLMKAYQDAVRTDAPQA